MSLLFNASFELLDLQILCLGHLLVFWYMHACRQMISYKEFATVGADLSLTLSVREINEKLTFWDIDNCTKWATSATAINKNFSLLLTVLAVFDIILYIQKQPPEVFYKKGVLRNFAKLTRKHLCQNLFFNKVRSATLLKRHPGKGVFLWILRNFQEHCFFTSSTMLC